MILIFEKGNRNSIYNIQSSYEQTNLETVKKIINYYFLGNITKDIPDLSDHVDYTYGRPGQDVSILLPVSLLKSLDGNQKGFRRKLTRIN